MLSKAKTPKGYKVNSLDGEIGKIKEFYFDDRHWAIRHLVADTGDWLAGYSDLTTHGSSVRQLIHVTLSATMNDWRATNYDNFSSRHQNR
jgi:hypothetical protein